MRRNAYIRFLEKRVSVILKEICAHMVVYPGTVKVKDGGVSVKGVGDLCEPDFGFSFGFYGWKIEEPIYMKLGFWDRKYFKHFLRYWSKRIASIDHKQKGSNA